MSLQLPDFKNPGRTWIVAEAGVNHEGDLAVAEDLVRKAAESGADAVKFQTYQVEKFVSSVLPERRARSGRFQLSYRDFRRLADVAKECGILFFSTPLQTDDVDFLDGLAPLFKIASGDLTYLKLIRHAMSKGKPVIISTGAGTPAEVRAAVDAALTERPDAGETGNLVLMHCVAAYPAPDGDVNLRNITWLQREFGLPVGYSDHTLGIKTCELAVAAGATVIEKHFTYRKENQSFHDHHLSADPDDMRHLVAAIRTAETLLGGPERKRGQAESQLVEAIRRSVAAAVEIPAGQPLRREWLTGLRPGTGIPAENMESLIGKRLSRAVPTGDLIYAKDIVD
jgi:N,N'-diacetyllegionaminate synthase